MLDRVLITFIIAGGLALVWIAWQNYKARLVQAMPSLESPTGKRTLLYFTGEYCTACKLRQTPIIQRVNAKLGGSIAVNTVDVSTAPDLATQYKVLTLPTTIVLDEQGQVTHVNYGLAEQAQLEAQLS